MATSGHLNGSMMHCVSGLEQNLHRLLHPCKKTVSQRSQPQECTLPITGATSGSSSTSDSSSNKVGERARSTDVGLSAKHSQCGIEDK
mmetsp:Transcript_19766/g.37705  ORF Transcript_19766/g.37705 Transcript_19766/m.37705 type:complete len:88 (+) Transcript_19766:731-994(+)